MKIFSKQQLAKKSDSELKLILRTWAKTANQRLRELEKQGMSRESRAYRYIEKESKSGAGYLTTTGGKVRGRSVGKSGKIKFKTDFRKMTSDQLREEAKQLEEFLFKAKTSTIKGIKEAHHKAYVTATQGGNGVPSYVVDFFSDLSEEEFMELWERGADKRNFYRIMAHLYEYSKENGLDNINTSDIFRLMDIVEDSEKTSLANLEYGIEQMNKLKEGMLPSDEDEINIQDIFGHPSNGIPF